MRPSLFSSATAGAVLATLLTTLTPATRALNILMDNDDGFASANIRELYRLLVADNHTVVMVAPATDQSGMGGRSVFSTSPTLQAPSEWGIVPAGAPALGQDPVDTNIWYYNGTPAACVFVALDYVIPTFYQNMTIDLMVSGPNAGVNLGAFVWTLSGTAGATYSAVTRGIPAIAFSAGGSEQRPYFWVNETTPSGYPDPATINAELSVEIVRSLINNTKEGDRLLPLGYGLNVNWAVIDSLKANATCVDPPFYQTRYTGGALTDKAVRNATTGTFKYGVYYDAGLNQCINGDCSLPGETDVVDGGCYGSVSVFTVDYTAPVGPADTSVRTKLEDAVSFGDPLGAKRRRSMTKREMEVSSPLRHE